MMKTKIFVTMMFASLAIMSISAQNDKVVKQQRNVAEFSAISASGGWDIIVRQGDRQSVSIEVSEKLLDRAVIEVKNGTLHIYNKNSEQTFLLKELRKIRYNTRNTVQKAYVTVTDLKKITASGGVDILFETPLKTEDFKLSMSGGTDLEDLSLHCIRFTGSFSGGCDAKIRFLSVHNLKMDVSGGSDVALFDIDSERSTVSASGGCDVKLTGKTDYFTINASGGCDVSAGDFIVRNCTATFSGSADGILYVSERLDISVSGASDVICYGNPRKVEKSIHKSSTLKIK